MLFYLIALNSPSENQPGSWQRRCEMLVNSVSGLEKEWSIFRFTHHCSHDGQILMKVHEARSTRNFRLLKPVYVSELPLKLTGTFTDLGPGSLRSSGCSANQPFQSWWTALRLSFNLRT